MEQAARAGSDFPIAIVGAGFAGIGTAIQLKKAGIHSSRSSSGRAMLAAPGATTPIRAPPATSPPTPTRSPSSRIPTWSRKLLRIRARSRRYLRRPGRQVAARAPPAPDTAIIDGAFRRGARRLDPHHEPRRGDHGARRRVLRRRSRRSEASRHQGPPQLRGRDLPHRALEPRLRSRRPPRGRDRHRRQRGPGGARRSRTRWSNSTSSSARPAWVVPKHDKAYSEREKRWFARFPCLLRASRYFKYWMQRALRPDDLPRLAAALDLGERLSLRHLRAQVKDPELRAQAHPGTSSSAASASCLRRLLGDASSVPNVELVTDPIEEIKRVGILTNDGPSASST